MNKFLAVIASFSTALVLVSAATSTPASAAAPTYKLVPATAVTSVKSVIVGETLWRCGPTGCVAGESSSRPAVVCAQAARKVGRIESFAANGTAFSTEELAKCNEKAKA
ncbi:MAG: hypothetical protein AABY88_06585 [Pseudomonadota bacterium]